MIYKIATTIIVSCTLVAAFGQTKPKNDLYLLFESTGSLEVSKTTVKESAEMTYSSKLRSPAVDYDIYRYNELSNNKIKKLFCFNTINKSEYYLCDSTFVNANVKTTKEIKRLKGIAYDSSDKEFPFKSVYIVEKIADNKFKVILVRSYMGIEDSFD